MVTAELNHSEEDFPNFLTFCEQLPGGETWWDEAMGLILGEVRPEYEELEAAQIRAGEERESMNQEEEQVAMILNLFGVPSNVEQEEFLEGSFLAEAVELPSTQRLFGLAQVNPFMNQVLGLNLTRGRHTADCMRLTAQILTREAIYHPELFDQLAQGYNVEVVEEEFPPIKDLSLARRIKIIQHLIEYMRRHDEMTIAFEGAWYAEPSLGQRYDENQVLLQALSVEEEDEEVKIFYENHHLQRDVVRMIAEEAVNGSLNLAQILKGKGKSNGKRGLGIDFIAYTARDASELVRAFGEDEDLPFIEKIKVVFSRMKEFSEALAEERPIEIEPGNSTSIPVSEFFQPNMVKLGVDDNQPVFIFDPLSVYKLYLSHFLLRLYFSGSPLVRGTDLLIKDYYQRRFANDNPAIFAYLLEQTEEKLLQEELREVMPIIDLSSEDLLNPAVFPTQVKGWSYSCTLGIYPELRFVFKDVSNTLIMMPEGQILSLDQAFPCLLGVKKKLEQLIDHQPLYLKHSI